MQLPTSTCFNKHICIHFIALKFLRGKKDVLADIEEMETEQSDVQKKGSDQETYSMLKLLTSRDLRKPLIIAVFLNVIQQLSGINAVSVKLLER